MKENRTTRLVITALLTLFAAYAVHDPSKFRLGPDLSGGTILIYQVGAGDDERTPDVEKLMPALKERLDPAGLFNYVIRPLGNDRIEIVMPRAINEDVDRVKRLISTVGQLQFKIVANRKKNSDLIDRAEINWPSKLIGQEGVFVRYGAWVPVDITKAENKELLAKAEASFPNDPEGTEARFKTSGQLENVQINESRMLVKTAPDGRKMVLTTWSADDLNFDPSQNLVQVDEETGDHYVLMYNDPYNVTGQYLTRVGQTTAQGGPAVSFQFNGEGATKFLDLTTEFKPDKDGFRSQLGVVLDNRVRSAPAINQPIGGNGIIEGNFTTEEVKELVRILDAGQLPVALEKEPSSQFQIGATLGTDTIIKGSISIAVALAAVIIFMVVYYRVAGAVAIIGLTLNLLFTVALMVLFRATWTLPGLAGLVLTIGMAVDSNVLIYERLREELDRGASLGMAIRAGYEKAFSAILDGNLTTVATAIILFVIGTDQIKGFAVTLIMGIATSLFCVLYVSRAIFEVLYNKRWLNKLHMMKLLTKTNIDFLKYDKIAYAVSGLLIVGGMVALIARGSQNLDVDFTGGTMVGLKFTQRLSSAEVRRLASEVLANVSVEQVELQGEEPGTHFVIRTTERNTSAEQEGQDLEDSVQGKIARVFRDYLQLPKMSVGEPTTILANPEEAALAPFVGGQVVEISFEEAYPTDFVRGAINEVLLELRPQVADPENLYALVPVRGEEPVTSVLAVEQTFRKFQLGTKVEVPELVGAVKTQLESSPAFEQFSQFGPQVAAETQLRAAWAIALSWVAIVAYVWFRFGSWTFGLAGVAALVHDVLVSLGVVAMVSTLASWFPGLEQIYIVDMKINLNTIAAILTLIGYSINDTIVIFDRIREVRGKTPKLSAAIVNRSVNETLSRSIITSLTTLVVVLILFFGAGAELRGFAFFLVVGVIVGSYSTIFIANPILLALTNFQDRRNERASSRASQSATAASVK